MQLPQIIIVFLASVLTAAGPQASSHAPIVALSEVSHIHGIGFFSDGSGKVLLATHFGVYVADPGGKAFLLSADQNDYMGFVIGPEARLYASGHPAGGGNTGVVVSEDGGANWSALSDGAGGPVDFHAMTVSPADPDVLYGLFKGIQVSHDGGKTWAIAGPAPDQTIDLAAVADAAGHLYAGTMTGLMESQDFGANWTTVDLTSVPVTAVEIEGSGFVQAFAAGEGLYRLDPASGVWRKLASAFGDQIILHMAADTRVPGRLAAVTQDSTLIASADGGRTWGLFAP